MMSVSSRPPAIKIEILLWVVVALVALLLRLPALDNPPLNDAEAASALASLSGDDMPFAGLDSPLIAVLNAGIFALTGGTDASARLLPALSGILLALTPIWLRKRLGSPTALLAAFWLAVSPSLVAASRQVSGQSLAALCAIGLLVLLLADLEKERSLKALLIGSLLAAGFLADDGFGRVLIALAAGVIFMRLTGRGESLPEEHPMAVLRALPWGFAGLAFAGIALLLSTGFFVFPAGLSAIGEQLAAVITTFWQQDPAASMPIFSLFAYEGFLVVLGLVALWRFGGGSSPFLRFLAGWGGASLLIALFARGGAALDSAYVVLPFALLASHLVTTSLAKGLDSPSSPLFAIGVIALLAMIANNINIFQAGQRSAVYGAAALPGGLPLELILAALWAALLIVITATVWLNRGRASALQGLALAWLVCGLIFSLGEGISTAYIRPSNPNNLLRPAPAQPSLALLIEEINGINKTANGSLRDAGVVIEGQPEGAVAWALRSFPSVTYVDNISQTESRAILITPLTRPDLITSSSYVGQSFNVSARWSPAGLTFPQVLNWLFTGHAATSATPEGVILWMRDDIYLLQANTVR